MSEAARVQMWPQNSLKLFFILTELLNSSFSGLMVAAKSRVEGNKSDSKCQCHNIAIVICLFIGFWGH